jgi:hypothetical protein
MGLRKVRYLCRRHLREASLDNWGAVRIMNGLPPILARDYAIHRVRATGCFFAFGAAGTAIAVALMAVLWICK